MFSPQAVAANFAPTITLYGVHKLANEGTARVYWLEDGVPSVGLRPYVVYGPGRDTGMTAGPTLAMAAAVRASEGVAVCNIPGQSMHMSEVIAAIEAAVPEARIDYEDIALPFPEQLAIGELAAPVTPLAEGVRQTIELFRARAL